MRMTCSIADSRDRPQRVETGSRTIGGNNRPRRVSGPFEKLGEKQSFILIARLCYAAISKRTRDTTSDAGSKRPPASPLQGSPRGQHLFKGKHSVLTKRQHLALPLMLALMAACAPTVAERPQDYSAKPPFSAERFWDKALALLNEREGYVGREQFEKTFGVRLRPVQFHGPMMTPYQLHPGIDWYFTTYLTIFSEAFTDRTELDANGVHSLWGLFWSADSFGDPNKQECLTVARVQTDLLSSGWTSPWGFTPQGTQVSHACHAGAGCLTQVSNIQIPPSHNFGRQGTLHTERWGQLPFGQFVSTGETPTSCVTGFYVRARP
jgi:hypothetical protein